MPWFFERSARIDKSEVLALVRKSAREARRRICENPKKVLLLPPDITRAHCGAGWITEALYLEFSSTAEVFVMPTLSQHVQHTPEQNRWRDVSIPEDLILFHYCIRDTKLIGAIPAEYVSAIMDGKVDWELPFSVNKTLLEGGWDLIINVGQVVPHEVLGFANHNKNYFIGLGGRDTIAATHMASACHGIEANMGRLVTPLRHCFNKAESEFLGKLPDYYIMVVMASDMDGNLAHTGFYCGNDLDTYIMAAEQSMKENITVVPPLKKVVAFMREDEYHSTWVADKAVYRTRKAMADGGELIVIAPGLKRFGEHADIDRLIRKYGYAGAEKITKAWKEDSELKRLAHAAAHLIHGSSEGRFTVTYAPGGLSQGDIEGVGYQYLDLSEALRRYNPADLNEGFNTLADGEEVYCIKNPSAGLWSTADKLN